MLAGDFTNVVEPIDPDHFFMGRDLQNRIRRRVENRFAGANVLVSELLQNRRTTARIVADELHPGVTFNRVNEIVRETFIDREGFVEDYAGQLPMSRRGVFAGGAFPHFSEAGTGHAEACLSGGTCFCTSAFCDELAQA